jgi:hypothetical protein
MKARRPAVQHFGRLLLGGANPWKQAGPRCSASPFAGVTYGGHTHLLVAAIQARNREVLRAFLPAAEHVIASARAPVTPA